ncbi:MAG: response regulator transcription factor [Spirochaetia bacterium]|nr:response regulator transcription factor [Spirochaetia bacterium]
MITRVYLIDDHPTFRAGTRSILESQSDLHVVGEAGSARVAIGQLRLISVDLVMLDIGLPDASGLSIISELVSLKPGLKVIVFTLHRDWSYLASAEEAGASGYLLKDADPEQLIMGIRQVMQGNFVSPERAGTGLRSPSSSHDIAFLSSREREVLRLVGQGKLSREIAETLSISVRTVDAHRGRLLEKLNLKSAAELVKFAVGIHLSQG